MMGITNKVLNENGQQSEALASWENIARNILVREMKKQKIGYKQLSRQLESMGIFESPDRINRKINRKRFSAAFFLACCRAMGITSLVLW